MIFILIFFYIRVFAVIRNTSNINSSSKGEAFLRFFSLILVILILFCFFLSFLEKKLRVLKILKRNIFNFLNLKLSILVLFIRPT